MQRSSSPSNEPTSKYFVAKLGALDPAVEQRFQRWAATSCDEHAMRQHKDGSVHLYAVKSSAKTARQYQSLLRTLSSHWKLPLGKLDRGWLSLLNEGEYRTAVGSQSPDRPASPGAALPGTGSECDACPAAAPAAEVTLCEKINSSQKGHLMPADANIVHAGELKPFAGPHCCGSHFMRLSDGFDQRSGELLATMRAQTAC